MKVDDLLSAYNAGIKQRKSKPNNPYPYFHPKQQVMKPTPITDILQKKLYKLHEEVDALIIKKVKKDLTQAQYESLDEELNNDIHSFITLEVFRHKISINKKIELFKRLEEL